MSKVDLWEPLVRDWSRALRAENKSPRTIDIYTSAARLLGTWAAKLPEPPAPGEIGVRHVRDFIAHRVETTSPGNANTEYRALQQWFKFLVNEDEIDQHPMANMKPPHIPEQQVPVIPDDLLRQVLDTCTGKDFTSRRDTALIRLIFDTGARLAEVANLTVDDVDLRTDVIHVVGKGGKARAVPFGPKTGRAITRYLRVRAQHRHADTSRLWLGDRNRPPLGSNGILQMLRRRGNAIGIQGELGRNLHAHLGRHAVSHHWQAAGGSEADLMLLMGWTSPQMPRRYGKSAATERAHAAARKLRLGDRI
jgi:integrase/recombinase XerC